MLEGAGGVQLRGRQACRNEGWVGGGEGRGSCESTACLLQQPHALAARHASPRGPPDCCNAGAAVQGVGPCRRAVLPATARSSSPSLPCPPAPPPAPPLAPPPPDCAKLVMGFRRQPWTTVWRSLRHAATSAAGMFATSGDSLWHGQSALEARRGAMGRRQRHAWSGDAGRGGQAAEAGPGDAPRGWLTSAAGRPAYTHPSSRASLQAWQTAGKRTTKHPQVQTADEEQRTAAQRTCTAP